MSASLDRSINRYGLTEINGSYIDANVDIVFVHGVDGHPERTWTSGWNGKSKVFWPSQLLPPMIEEKKARILVYGYDACLTSFMDGDAGGKIHNHAEHLIAELCANRRIRKATERPIVFVAHSLGGLVVKRALIYSSEVRGNYMEHLRSVYVSTYGILFLGTPRLGADLTKWHSRLGRIWVATNLGPDFDEDYNDFLSQWLDAVEINCETIQNIDRQFIQLIHRYHVYFFHEGELTKIRGDYCYTVEEQSAAPVIQDVERACIQQNHAQMCKFEDDDTPGFSVVAEGIQRYAAEAPAIIQRRWETEKAERQRSKEMVAKELIGITESAITQASPVDLAGHVIDRMAPNDSGPMRRNHSESQHCYYFNFLNLFSANKTSHRNG